MADRGLFASGAEPGRPYWWDGVTWPELPLGVPDKTDLLVIGAGYTGLSAAIAAHDAGARVVVIDSGQPGKGASTRNGGMLGAHPRLGWDTLARRYGEAVADALYAEAGEALDWVKNFIACEGIDCDLKETGRIQLAYTDDHYAAQRKVAAQVSEKGGVACRVLTQQDLAGEIGHTALQGRHPISQSRRFAPRQVSAWIFGCSAVPGHSCHTRHAGDRHRPNCNGAPGADASRNDRGGQDRSCHKWLYRWPFPLVPPSGFSGAKLYGRDRPIAARFDYQACTR